MGRRKLQDPRVITVAVRVCWIHDPVLYRALVAMPQERRSARLRDALKIGLLGENPAPRVSPPVPRVAPEATRAPTPRSATLQAQYTAAADAKNPITGAAAPLPTSDEERDVLGGFGQQWLSAFDPGA